MIIERNVADLTISLNKLGDDYRDELNELRTAVGEVRGIVDAKLMETPVRKPVRRRTGS